MSAAGILNGSTLNGLALSGPSERISGMTVTAYANVIVYDLIVADRISTAAPLSTLREVSRA